MPRQCLECQGVYEPHNQDGTDYFHTCPPLTLVPVTRGGAKIGVPVSDLRPTDTVTVRRGNQTIDVLVSAQQPDDVRQGDVQQPRAARRDENVDPTKGGPPRGMKAEGKGAKDV